MCAYCSKLLKGKTKLLTVPRETGAAVGYVGQIIRTDPSALERGEGLPAPHCQYAPRGGAVWQPGQANPSLRCNLARRNRACASRVVAHGTVSPYSRSYS